MTFFVKYAWLYAGLAMAFGVHSESENPKQLKLVIERKVKTDKCMRGYLRTKRSGENEAKVQCFVLEMPPRGDSPKLNAIPAGTYKVMVRIDGDRGWRLEIMGVPGGKSVFVRLGNCPENTLNCLLPGTKAGLDECSVVETAAAMEGLKDVFKIFGASGETTITIQ